MTADHIKEVAHELVERLRADISKAVTREEHIRASARANEAHNLLESLHRFFSPEQVDDLNTDAPQERGEPAA